MCVREYTHKCIWVHVSVHPQMPGEGVRSHGGGDAGGWKAQAHYGSAETSTLVLLVTVSALTPACACK